MDSIELVRLIVLGDIRLTELISAFLDPNYTIESCGLIIALLAFALPVIIAFIRNSTHKKYILVLNICLIFASYIPYTIHAILWVVLVALSLLDAGNMVTRLKTKIVKTDQSESLEDAQELLSKAYDIIQSVENNTNIKILRLKLQDAKESLIDCNIKLENAKTMMEVVVKKRAFLEAEKKEEEQKEQKWQKRERAESIIDEDFTVDHFGSITESDTEPDPDSGDNIQGD